MVALPNITATMERAIPFDEEKFREAIKYICYLYNIETLHEDQLLAVKAFLDGKDVYFSAGTGYGKSLIFQALPFIVDNLLDQPYGVSSLIVLSPLQALVEDQVAKLKQTGIPAVALHEKQPNFEKLLQGVEDDHYSLIYGSPESILEKKHWRKIVSSETFQKHCIGVAVDEAHCIVQWGLDEKSATPFRVWYSRIVEMKSLLSGNLKFAIFTATATKAIQLKILNNLDISYDKLYLVQKDPNRKNIRYAFSYLDNKNELSLTFAPYIADLKQNWESSGQTLIFCQTRKQCVLLYNTFCDELGDKLYSCESKSQKSRIVDMFHASTPQSVKTHIINQMTQSNAHLRLLICTVAFGMGINCLNVNNVVHFGPSKNMELYLQESGRAGRKGADSTSIILYNSLLTVKCDPCMRLFLKTEHCRRRQISVLFLHGMSSYTCVGCKCCDICTKACDCGAESGKRWLNLGQILKNDYVAASIRNVSTSQKEVLAESLKSYRSSLLGACYKVRPVAYPNIFMEFGFLQIRQVLENCHRIFTLEDIKNFVEIWRKIHANDILAIIEEVFEDTNVDLDKLELTECSQESEILEIPKTWADIRDDTEIGDMLLDSQLAEQLDAQISILDSEVPSDDEGSCNEFLSPLVKMMRLDSDV